MIEPKIRAKPVKSIGHIVWLPIDGDSGTFYKVGILLVSKLLIRLT